jgi:hypothetical protein
MIILGIIAFGVMCLTAFAVGCGIGELEIWLEEREKHDEG